MRSKNHPPRKCHKDWHDWLRANVRVCSNPGCNQPAQELHHILGAAAMNAGFWIGQWACNMLCSDCNHQRNGKRLASKIEQVWHFVRGPIADYWNRFNEIPMSKDELMAIATWSR